MGKRDMQRAATKARLLGVAREAFRGRSYEAVTLRDLARLADVSTGAFFSYWSGKEALWEDATGRARPDVPEFLERVATRLCGTDDADLADEALSIRTALVGEG